MKVLQVYNDYRSECGGEARVVEMTASAIDKHGGCARLWMCSSKGLDATLRGRIRAFVSGIYNPEASREMARLLRDEQPDVVHVHNLYPLLSPSVLVACRKAGVPVVMTNHNYLLTCPIVSHLHRGEICERCMDGREYWCVLKNCRGNIAESMAYAARSMTARVLRLFQEYVSVHIVLSQFAKERLVRAGFDSERIVVLPNMVDLEVPSDRASLGTYAAYSGRMAPEKGVGVLLEAIAELPQVALRLAGNGPLLDNLQAKAPANAHFLNRLAPPEMARFYQEARFLVVPSQWFEGCPLVVAEAMSQGLPVIASRIGALPELIDDGVTGLLFQPGNAADLREKIRHLWESPDLCRNMGAAARSKAEREFGEQAYFDGLMAVYQKASDLCASDGSRRTGMFSKSRLRRREPLRTTA
jgi:glycosyltransferase involved in cell wall biosynthesis